MMNIGKKNNGLTLVELMAVIAISSILGALALTLAITLSNNFSRAQKENIFQDNSRLIYSRIEDDMRGAKFIDINPSYTGGQVTIDGKTYSLPSISAKPIVTFIYKKGGDTISCAYLLDSINKEFYKVEALKGLPTSALNRSTTAFNDVKEFKIEKIVKADGTVSNKEYKLILEFEDNKGNSEKYESVIVTRN